MFLTEEVNSHRRTSPRCGSPPRAVAAGVPARPPAIGGRWSLLPAAEPDAALRATATASLLLDRYGVVTRGAVQSEGVPGGFAQTYRVLAGFEEAGHCRRGYVIEKLGAAQFAASATVDRLREFAGLSDPPPLRAVTLAATDPANPYGAALAWPALEGVGHRPGRKAGALVVLVDGALALYLERGGKSALAFTGDEAVLAAATRDLAATARARRLDTLTIEQVNGAFVYGTVVGRGAQGCRFRRVSARTHAAAAHRGRRPATGSGTGTRGRPCLRATPSSAPPGASTTRWRARP